MGMLGPGSTVSISVLHDIYDIILIISVINAINRLICINIVIECVLKKQKNLLSKTKISTKLLFFEKIFIHYISKK